MIAKRKRPLLTWAGLLLLAALGLGMIGWMFTRDSGKRLRVPRARLMTAAVSRGPFQAFIPLTGTVEPLHSVQIHAMHGGRVVEVDVENGHVVSEGQLLLRLRNDELQLNYLNQETRILEQMHHLSQARTTLTQDGLNLRDACLELEYQLTQAERTFRRNSTLVKHGAIPAESHTTAQEDYTYLKRKYTLMQDRLRQDSMLRTMQLNQINPSLRLMERNLKQIHQTLAQLAVRAPMQGQLSAFDLYPGQYIQPDQPIGQIDRLDTFRVQAQVDEHYLDQLQLGQTGRCSLHDHIYNLVVTKLHPEVESGTFTVDMMFQGQAPEGLRRGQSLQIRLALSESAEALRLRRGPFFHTTGGSWVYRIAPDCTRAIRQPIRLGRQNPLYFEVLAGLQPGDVVVISSYDPFNEADVLLLED